MQEIKKTLRGIVISAVFFLLIFVERVHSHGALSQQPVHSELHQQFHGGPGRGLKALAPAPSPSTERIAIPPTPPLAAHLNTSVFGKGFWGANPSDPTCGSPLMKPSLGLVVNMFFEFLHEELPANATLKTVDTTNLTAWRGILVNPVAVTGLWGGVVDLAKDYFNLSLPLNPMQLKLPAIIAGASGRRLLQTPLNVLYTIPVNFIVIEPQGQTLVQQPNLQAQIAKLNVDYAGTGFSFALSGVEYLVGDIWFNQPVNSPYDVYYKDMYRKGGPETLNVFVRKPNSGDPNYTLYGQAYFPYDLCSSGVYDSNNLRFDSITYHYGVLPGMSRQFTGAILSHEVGHWLGLGHTFNQPPADVGPTCDDYWGDGISDTPVEKIANNQSPGYATDPCSLSADSCPSQTGKDPVQNHMDYSPDSCATTFTPLQINRMQWSYYSFRMQRQCTVSVETGFSRGQAASTPAPRPSGGSLSSRLSISQSLLMALVAHTAILLPLSL